MAKKRKERPMADLQETYKDVKLEGDCGSFMLYYTPLCKGGKPQRLTLDADTEEDARFEAASTLGCDENELPQTEWM